MAFSQSSLVSLLLKQQFGEVVQKVGSVLQERNATNLKTLLIKTKLPKTAVVNSLEILIARDLVQFYENELGTYEYMLVDDNVLRILNHSRYVYNTKHRYGLIGELIVEVILDNGTLSTTELFYQVDEILSKSEETKFMFPEVKTKFQELVEARFLQRNFGKKVDNDKLYKLDEVMLEFRGKRTYILDNLTNKKKSEDENIEEAFWKPNFETFDLDIRDNIIVDYSQTKLDEKAAVILQSILNIAKTFPNNSKLKSALVNRQAIYKEVLKKDPNFNLEELNDYLYLLGDDNVKVISVATEKKHYVVNFSTTIKTMVQEFASSFIREKYGSSCGRVYHLLQLHSNLEQRQIEEMAMLNGKEANECIFNLHHDRLILTHYTVMNTQEASKNQHIFSVDLKFITRKLLNWAYQSIVNSLHIHDAILEQKGILLQKKMKVDTLIDAYKDQGLSTPHLQEIYEMISPFEKSEISKVEAMLDKLLGAVLQATHTIALLHCFLQLEEV